MSVTLRVPPPPLAQLVDAELAALVDEDGADLDPELWERALFGAARDMLARPGKQLRARLVEAGWRLGGGDGACPPLLLAALEVLHAGSLVVDDIEDDSTHRRGQPALHRRYGLPRALNCGNWLTFWPTFLLERLDLPAAAELALRRRMGRAILRCHHGQALDLSVRVFEHPRAGLPRVVEAIAALKTGALTELAVTAGAVAAGAPEERVAALGAFGREAGIALQMLDDLGGLAGERDPHKRHEDLRLGRPTWPWAWLARALDDAAFAELRALAAGVTLAGDDPAPLAALLRRLMGEQGRDDALSRLHLALARLRAQVGPAAEPLVDLVRRLEKSYV
jgi:geranylgeranyl pyrophosphate synthase